VESVLRRLSEVYRHEYRVYGRILEHVRRQRELIDRGAPYAEIGAELARKRELLQEIEGIEDGIADERARWRSRRQDMDGASAKELMGLLAGVAELVERIIDAERENEVLLTSQRRRGPRPLVSVRGAAARYRCASTVEVER
jgi:hypothetical protein